MFKKSENINKIRTLVDELCIRDSEVFSMRQVLELLLETCTDGFWDWRIKEDYEYLSPTFKKQLGFGPDEMENHPSSWQCMMYEEDLKILYEEVTKHFESRGEYKFSSVCRYTHRKGHMVTILCRGEVIEWDDDWSPIRMVGTHTDITDILKK